MAPSLRTKSLKEKREANGRTLALDGAAWRRLRKVVLAEQPLCRHCEWLGQVVPATEVDHADNDSSNNARENLVGLCKPCHSRKTMADLHGAKVKGCDSDGVPLDPTHPWRQAVEAEKAQKSPAAVSPQPTVPLHAHRRSC